MAHTLAVKAVDKSSTQTTKDKKAILRKLKAESNRISDKGTYRLPIHARIHAQNSNSRAPKLKMYALTNHPLANVCPQTFRSFETMDDLTNRDNRFIMVDELMEVLEENFAKLALLNRAAKAIYAAERKQQKSLKK